jgi:hypothetical protein
MVSQTNQPNREELLQMAENAAKGGQKDGARVMFRRVLDQDKRNERAMMWLARLAKTQKERKQWLTRVVAVNPDNKAAKSALQKMQYKRAAKENRTLLIFGVAVAVLIIIAVILVIAASAGG